MKLKKAALQTLSVVTAVGLSLGVAAPAGADEDEPQFGAKDLLSDNTHNLAGGGVNIHADNTCVEKIGDTAHVKFEVQHQPLQLSSHRRETSADGFIALPKSLKNVKIGIKAVADRAQQKDADYTEQKVAIYDTPVDMPIVDFEDDPEAPPMLGGSPGKLRDDQIEDERARGYEDRGFSKKTEPDTDDPDRVMEHYVPTEQELRDHIKKFGVHMRKLSPTPYTGGRDEYDGPFAQDVGFGMWYGNNITDYNIYEFGSLFTPTSFEIEADVVVEHDDTFVTGAVSNLGKKHFDEVKAGMEDTGFEIEGTQGYGWSKPGFLPPAIPSDPKMIEIYKDKLLDAGLDISPRIAPTAEMSGDSKYLHIGNDIHSSARGDVGYTYFMWHNLKKNLAVTYWGQVPYSAEDGADITAAHVTLCPSEETPDTETPDTDTPETDKETETPDTETPETETPETETEKEPTPSTEPKPNGSSLDEDTIKKVGLGLGLGLGGAALIEKAKEHRGGSSTSEHITKQPTPSTTKQPAPTTTVHPAPSSTAEQPAPSTTEQAAPAPSTSPAPAATASRTGTLAQTGANVTTLAVAGSLIVLAGAAFLLVSRRRKEEN